jgi:zinc knuckle protein
LLEQHAKKKPTYGTGHSYPRGNQTTTNRPINTLPNPRHNTNTEQKGKGVPPNKNVVCFKCHGTGHYKNDCPNNRADVGSPTSSSHMQAQINVLIHQMVNAHIQGPNDNNSSFNFVVTN